MDFYTPVEVKLSANTMAHCLNLAKKASISVGMFEEVESDPMANVISELEIALADARKQRFEAFNAKPEDFCTCDECGGLNVEYDAWVCLNTGEITGEGPRGTLYCPGCEDEKARVTWESERKEMSKEDNMDQMVQQLKCWCELNGFEHQCADEMLRVLDLNEDQRLYLQSFSRRWHDL